ncbi:MAG: MFS family permease [Maribacter sp.]|jgi:MFS family permease
MGNKILAVVVGLFVNALIVFLVETISHLIIPSPEGYERIMEFSLEERKAMMASLSIGAYLFLLIGWALGPFIGGMVASKILPDYWKTSSFVIGVMVALMLVLLNSTIPHPTWLITIGMVLPVPMSYLGGKIFGKEVNIS